MSMDFDQLRNPSARGQVGNFGTSRCKSCRSIYCDCCATARTRKRKTGHRCQRITSYATEERVSSSIWSFANQCTSLVAVNAVPEVAGTFFSKHFLIVYESESGSPRARALAFWPPFCERQASVQHFKKQRKVL